MAEPSSSGPASTSPGIIRRTLIVAERGVLSLRTKPCKTVVVGSAAVAVVVADGSGPERDQGEGAQHPGGVPPPCRHHRPRSSRVSRGVLLERPRPRHLRVRSERVSVRSAAARSARPVARWVHDNSLLHRHPRLLHRGRRPTVGHRPTRTRAAGRERHARLRRRSESSPTARTTRASPCSTSGSTRRRSTGTSPRTPSPDPVRSSDR